MPYPGISAVINDDITSTALFMACVATAMLSAFVTCGYMACKCPLLDKSEHFNDIQPLREK